MHTFVAPLLLRPPRLAESVVSKRAPSVSVIVAKGRTLDSYRAGDRGYGERKVKRISLLRALHIHNVASQETCEFMLRSGCIRVNGEVVRSGKEKVTLDDEISVNGRLLEDSNADNFHNNKDDDEFDRSILPRTQRDFANSEHIIDSYAKKYNRRVDRGFYSGSRPKRP